MKPISLSEDKFTHVALSLSLSCSSGSEALLYHLSEVRGMCLWKHKFEPLGLNAVAIEGTKRTTTRTTTRTIY